LRRINFKSKRK